MHEVCGRCLEPCKNPYTPWSGCMPDEQYCDKFKLDQEAAVQQAYQEGQRHPDEIVWGRREDLAKELEKEISPRKDRWHRGLNQGIRLGLEIIRSPGGGGPP